MSRRGRPSLSERASASGWVVAGWASSMAPHRSAAVRAGLSCLGDEGLVVRSPTSDDERLGCPSLPVCVSRLRRR